MASESNGDRNFANNTERKSYCVGYGRPPIATRFKPGVSGNPRGRRKKPASFSDVTEQVLNRKIEVRIGERVLRLTKREALVETAVRQALAGKPKLLCALPAIMRFESEHLRGGADTSSSITAEDAAILADFLARNKGIESPDGGNEP